ncbi:putative bifunctional diguanylate cyclase/phosphodiesterase [Croceibacterium aestuarii]|uniref:putative bifunctional diguanylate cyclase/phosphodiesterase n=1 Tax=Croceibacterium aestuarii TaxID=3064139 RepID=UPI00272ED96E|nr:EAL domain-containing protein [Croceibacterium sp. D39]
MRLLEWVFEIGAFSYALALGTLAAACVAMGAPTIIQLMSVTAAIGYGAGISARNAGRLPIAIGQLMLSITPTCVVLMFLPGFASKVLAVSLGLFVVVMISIGLNVFRTLRSSITAADTSARLADQMREQARTDVVTGLLNRAGLNHELVELQMQLPADQKLALFWLDLDRFKEINDTLGHSVGDGVLAEVARRIIDTAPAGAVIARFGGDEFIAACIVTDRAECEQLASAIIGDISRPYRIDGHRVSGGTSMGVAMLPDDGPDIDAVMQGADLALYHAKVQGRNQLRFFDQSMTRDLVRKKEIESELRAAIQKDELSIFFQPIVDLKSGKIRTFEALVRWFHPEKGELRPDEFIPVAEETGVIITLGNWITSQAAKAAAQWPKDVTVAVNLSPLQIRAPGAALGILSAIREAGLEPERLELEVTESLFLEDSEQTGRFMEELSAHGVRFALDDFGTGYSSLAYINQFPFKKIKVDRSFVSGPNIGRKSDAIIRAVAEMGSTLEMDIVAEGLETVEQVEAVRKAGCTLGQGYYFSRAVPDFLAAMLLSQERDDGAARTSGSRLAG